MKKFSEKTIKTILFISLGLNVLVGFKSCSSANEVKKMSKEIDKNEKALDSIKLVTPTKADVRNEMEEVMLDYLIYEDELDNKKITLSIIKDKIKSND